MIGHQAIGEHFRPDSATGVGEQRAVLHITFVRKERLLPAVPALRHMVGQCRRNHPWNSCHTNAAFSTQVDWRLRLLYFARAI